MSKYTYELYELMQNPRFDVFDFEYDFYTDDRKAIGNFEKKFLNRYAFSEINQKVVHKWKWQLKSRLDMIMPYYKQLYETELKSKELDFLLNKDYREEFIREVDRGLIENETNSENKNINSNNNSSSESNNTSSRKNITDSTLDNKSSSVDNGNASLSLDSLTGISQDKEKSTNSEDVKITNSERENRTGQTTENNSNSANKNTDEKLTEKTTTIGKGNIGVTSSAELLQKWRDVLINIDEMIINELSDLFLWVY